MQEVQLQLLEHFDEELALQAINALAQLLEVEPPLKRPVLEQRLRRIEEYAEDVQTSEAAAALRRALRARGESAAKRHSHAPIAAVVFPAGEMPELTLREFEARFRELVTALGRERANDGCVECERLPRLQRIRPSAATRSAWCAATTAFAARCAPTARIAVARAG